MNKQSMIIAGVIALVVVGGSAALFALSGSGGSAATREKDAMDPDTDAMVKDQAMVKDDAMMADEAMKKDAMDGDRIAAGGYVDYSPAELASATVNGGKAVLFFHASWCPTCKATDMAFKNASGELPAGVTVLKTDYDSNTDLKAKYGITYQHTFVQVDAQGNEITKWNGGDVAELAQNVR